MLLQLRLDDVGDGRRTPRPAARARSHVDAATAQLYEWRADPEALACAELLPPLDEEGSFAEVLLLDGDDGDDDDDGFGGDDDDDEGGGDGDDEGGGGGANAYGRVAAGGGGNCLAALLDARPDEGAAALPALLPAKAMRRPSRGAQLKATRYAAVGLSAYQLQSALPYTAVPRRRRARPRRSAARRPPRSRRGAAAAVLVEHGSGGDGDDDATACAGSYAVLVGVLRAVPTRRQSCRPHACSALGAERRRPPHQPLARRARRAAAALAAATDDEACRCSFASPRSW